MRRLSKSSYINLANTQVIGLALTKLNSTLDADTAKEIESIFHFKVVDNLGMYLGIPFLHGRVTCANFKYIIDKVQRRLNGWSAASLSLAARVTLAKAVLSAIPTYCMHVVMLPANVIDEVDPTICMGWF